MEENLDITKPRFSEPVLPVPWPFEIMEVPLYWIPDFLSVETGFRIPIVSGNLDSWS